MLFQGVQSGAGRFVSSIGLARRLAAAALAIALAGCGNPNVRQGDDLYKQGQYEDAAKAYRAAEVEVPGDREISRKRADAETQAAMVRYQAGIERAAAGDLEAAVREQEAAATLDPWFPKAKDELSRLRPRLAAAQEAVVRAETLVQGGSGVAAVEALAPFETYVRASPARRELAFRASQAAIAELRASAEKRLGVGDAEGASADLARARTIEQSIARLSPQGRPTESRGGAAKPAPAEVAGGGVGSPSEAARPPEPSPPKGGDLEAYARAAVEVKRLTSDLPRRKPGSGIAKPEDYALPEEDVLSLERAVNQAAAAKPPAEKTPQWLAHGRICLRMAREVAGFARIQNARRVVESGDALGGWLELDAARRVDPSSIDAPEVTEDVAYVRGAVAKRLIELGRRDLDAGYPRLARLRARQAREIGPASISGDASDLTTRCEAVIRGRPIVVMPFLDYTSSGDPLPERFQDALFDRLRKGVSAPCVEFGAWQKEKGIASAVLLPVAILKGDLLRLSVLDARDAAGVAAGRVEAERRRFEEARRRRDAADASGDTSAQGRAQQALDEAERTLARAEREKAATAVAATRSARSGAGNVAPGDVPITATLEIQYQLHDPESGRDVIAEHVVRTAEGRAADRAHVVEKLLDEATEPIITAVTARLFDVTAAARRAGGGDDRGGVESRIASLEAAPGGADAGAAAAVLDATGFVWAERRTDPSRLRLE